MSRKWGNEEDNARQKLIQLQSLPLSSKIQMTKGRIKAFYEHFDGDVFVAFSGGKDSTVLLHLVRSIYPEVTGMFANTGLEFPEIVSFVREQENIVEVRPRKNFKKVIEEDGYPLVSKKAAGSIRCYNRTSNPDVAHRMLNGSEKGTASMIPKKWQYLVEEKSGIKVTDRCCDYFKKYPSKDFQKETGLHPIIGTMAVESQRRTNFYTGHCNTYGGKEPKSTPMIFWNEDNVWEYIKRHNLKVSEAYTKHGYKRTGCIFCAYGTHLEEKTEEKNRFERLKETHPKLWKYCMDKLGFREALKIYGVRTGEEAKIKTLQDFMNNEENKKR